MQKLIKKKKNREICCTHQKIDFMKKIREIGCSKTDEICMFNQIHEKNREIGFAKKSKEVSLMISHKNFEISMVVQKR